MLLRELLCLSSLAQQQLYTCGSCGSCSQATNKDFLCFLFFFIILREEMSVGGIFQRSRQF